MEYILLAIIVLIAVAGYSTYVKLIKLRNQALEALSGIDVQMQKRFDLVPNVLRVARRFMEHEKDLFTEVAALRSKVMEGYDKNKPTEVNSHVQAMQSLSDKFGQLMINVESYPDLRSDKAIMEAMHTYHEVESHISASRRFYNTSVIDLNNVVQIFPSSVIANMVGVRAMELFKAQEQAREGVNAEAFLY
ncbi:Protein LemA [Vibrio stylophorae]|uniref:Protein LemA n=1 Tax=Vibrio stylophorae TaxID=659351 RepID=A0ABM8ZSN7_9VIBR|nr:LemA family protein [Vibrio stylophorae]CAH0533327.1 Protein LemA [Vibrio stylophorae]